MRDQDGARAYHQHAGNDHKFEMITFNNAFHGRTMATISASNQEKMHKGFKPLLPGFKYVDFDDLEGPRPRSVRTRQASWSNRSRAKAASAWLAGIHAGPARAGRRA
jgi:adenosylmethionine-8-amino-7-oxononanoate aminotransferase